MNHEWKLLVNSNRSCCCPQADWFCEQQLPAINQQLSAIVKQLVGHCEADEHSWHKQWANNLQQSANKQAFYDSENAVLRPRNRRLIFENRRFTTRKPLFCGQLCHTFKILFRSSFVCTPLGFRRFACRRTFVDKRSSLLGERQSRNSLRRAAEPKLAPCAR